MDIPSHSVQIDKIIYIYNYLYFILIHRIYIYVHIFYIHTIITCINIIVSLNSYKLRSVDTAASCRRLRSLAADFERQPRGSILGTSGHGLFVGSQTLGIWQQNCDSTMKNGNLGVRSGDLSISHDGKMVVESTKLGIQWIVSLENPQETGWLLHLHIIRI